MDCSEALRARRSVRKFKEGVKIPSEHLKLLLEAAMCAPSAVNSRPWEFFIAESEEAKASLMAAHPASRMLATASLAIVVCGRPGPQANLEFLPQGCAAATENILLQAGGPRLRQLLVRLLPCPAAHGCGAQGARHERRARIHHSDRRAGRTARHEGVL